MRVFGSDADISPVIGIQAPCLPSRVCFGSDADISPAIGSRAPRLPVCVCLCACQPSYECSDSSLVREDTYAWDAIS